MWRRPSDANHNNSKNSNGNPEYLSLTGIISKVAAGSAAGLAVLAPVLPQVANLSIVNTQT